MTLSREARIYLAIWRKAYRERDNPEPVSLNSPNQSTAISLQAGLYRAIRPYRTGKAFDPELQAAADNFVVKLLPPETEGGPSRIIMQHRRTLSTLEAELVSLGICEDDLLTSEELLMNQQLDRIIASTGEASKPVPLPEPPPPAYPTARPANPFFTRED